MTIQCALPFIRPTGEAHGHKDTVITTVNSFCHGLVTVASHNDR